MLDEYDFLQLPWSGERTPFAGPSREMLGLVAPIWADDIAVAIRHPSAAGLVHVIPLIATRILHRLAISGLTPNLLPGKTELFLDLHGVGSVAVRQELTLRGNEFSLDTPLIDVPLRVVGQYRHLGTIMQVGGQLSRDLAAKFGAAHETISKYKTQIFANKGLALQDKKRLLDSLVLSAILYNSATWVARTSKQSRQISAGFARLYKRVALLHFGLSAKEWSLNKVIAEIGLAEPDVLLRTARLRYFLQMVRHGQPHFCAFVQQEATWFSLVQEDLMWLRSFCPEEDLPDGTPASWGVCLSWSKEGAKQWKSLLRRATARSVAHQKRVYDWNEWHRWVYAYLLDHGVPRCSTVSAADEFYCLACGKSFASASAMSVHAFKKHQRVNAIRRFVTGLQCECCLRHYSSTINLQNHAKNVSRCLNFYLARPELVDIEPGVNSRAVEKARVARPDPLLQAAGPRAPDDVLLPAQFDLSGEEHRLWRDWSAAFQESHDYGSDLLKQLREIAVTTFLYPSEIKKVFRKWTDDILAKNEEVPLVCVQTFVGPSLRRCPFPGLLRRRM